MKHRASQSAHLFAALMMFVVIILAARPALALESDQFTLPPEPLADLGPEFDAHLRAEIERAVSKINAKLTDLENRLEETTSDHWKKYFRKEIDKHAKPRMLVNEVRSLTGKGIPACTIERWVADHKFEATPARFAIDYGDSVFGASAIFKPLLLLALAPSVRIHGVDMGTDKVGHIFQQGYEYYKIFDKERQRGRSDEDAIRAAVRAGVGKEKSIYGKWWTGVVSNADLAANYAGLKFYINLTEPVTIDGATLPPRFVMRDGQWEWNEQATHLIQPFITEHYSEAFNPSMYDGAVRGSVRKALRSRGKAWVNFHNTDREAEARRLDRVTTWFGEDYGHEGGEKLVTIVNAYFDIMSEEQGESDDPTTTAAADTEHDASGSN